MKQSGALAPRPRAGRLRVIVAALALQVAFGLVFAWGAVVPDALRQGWSPLLVSAVFSATPCGYGIGAVVGGRLADRVPPRRLEWLALGLLGAGFAVAFLVPTGATFVAGYGFLALGLGGGVALSGGVAALAGVMPGRRGVATGAATAAYALSAIVQAPVLGALIPALGWIHALAAVAMTTAALAVAAVAVSPPTPVPARAGGTALPPLGAILRRGSIWSGVATVFAASTCGPAVAVNVVAVAGYHGMTGTGAGAAVVLVATGNTAMRLLGGWASDLIGVDVALGVVLAMEVAAGLLLYTAGGAGSVLLGAASGGLALGGAGLVGRVAADAAPDAPSTAFGLVFPGYTLAALAGPLVGAAAGWPVGWLVVAGPALAGATILCIRRAGRHRR